jgi:hypothetical protein
MVVDYLVVADAAIAVEGKHYVHGAGWDVIWSSSFPAVQNQFAAALRLRVPWSDTNQPHMVKVDVVDADAVTLLPSPPGPLGGALTAGRPPQLPVGEDQVIVLTFTFVQVTFPQPGTYAVTVSIDGVECARAPFRVAAPPGAVTATPANPPTAA